MDCRAGRGLYGRGEWCSQWRIAWDNYARDGQLTAGPDGVRILLWWAYFDGRQNCLRDVAVLRVPVLGLNSPAQAILSSSRVPSRSKNRARIGIIDPSVPPVKLLRGINVGGKNKLPMKDLTAMFREAGCDDVRTLHPEWERSISSRSGAGRRHPVPDQCVNLEPLRLSRSSGRPHGPRAPGDRAGQPLRGSWSRSEQVARPLPGGTTRPGRTLKRWTLIARQATRPARSGSTLGAPVRGQQLEGPRHVLDVLGSAPMP